MLMLGSDLSPPPRFDSIVGYLARLASAKQLCLKGLHIPAACVMCSNIRMQSYVSSSFLDPRPLIILMISSSVPKVSQIHFRLADDCAGVLLDRHIADLNAMLIVIGKQAHIASAIQGDLYVADAHLG